LRLLETGKRIFSEVRLWLVHILLFIMSLAFQSLCEIDLFANSVIIADTMKYRARLLCVAYTKFFINLFSIDYNPISADRAGDAAESVTSSEGIVLQQRRRHGCRGGVLK